MRLFWAVTLCFFLSGCSYQRLGLPTDTNAVGEIEEDRPVVKVGQRVEVVTVDGSKSKGEVVSVSIEKIVLGKPGNYGFEETVFLAGDITEIKQEKTPGIFIGVIMGVAILIVIGMISLSQMDWGHI